MKALLLVREQTEDDDSDGEEDDGPGPSGKHHPKRARRGRPLRIRCYACAGSGKLEIVELPPEGGSRDGRVVRCIACHGTGRVPVM